MGQSKKIVTIITYLALGLGAIIMVFPFLWMILTSSKTVTESMRIPPSIFPAQIMLDNFKDAIASLPFVNMYLNTALMIVFRVIFAVAFSSMAGYAFAKLHFRGKNILFGIVLMQMMLPSQIFIIPQYQMVAKLGMANTIFALVFPGLVSAFGTFFLRQAYMGIPNEIGEAAYLDGCNQWQSFYKVMFPLTSSSVAALTVFTAVFAYGDLMWPLVVNSDLKMMTLSSGLATLRGQFSTNFPVLMAGSLLAMLPMVILYLFFQRQFIEGVAMTGGK
ncbi:carbohydrate ABC transporter permease [Pseudoflavonifractor sp. 524-17]|uniref:carbohydrate ABC transporter permease n=1 Tax=Pseudoflavonifractor sp. 524-17 TaxID=2304577 RepID=UPI00137AA50C|nr:carbohydrate ABC transporter permease [Pseudoflavonifractor sp. 524-17]NCE65762.1 carbohydrate ABC transporter permease [Pseudoflavonifractor sp. 524-17]